MSISKDEVKHIANLSKLNLTDEELEKYTNELSIWQTNYLVLMLKE